MKPIAVNLEREIGAVFRHIAIQVAEGVDITAQIDGEQLPSILGAKKFDSDVAA